MSDNALTTGEASGKVCPVGPASESHSYMRSSDYSRPPNLQSMYEQKIDGVAVTRTWAFCAADRCAMWTWLPDSQTRGYCGLRGKVVIP